MKTEIFPINYFKSIWSPIQGFKNRHQLNWFTIIIIIIFINGLMTIPTTINFLEMDTFSLDYFYPNAIKTVDDNVIDELSEIQSKNGELIFNDSFVYENETGVIAGGMQDEERDRILNKETFVLLEEHQFIIKEEKKPEASVFYTKDFTLENVSSKKDLRNQLSQQWFMQNKVLIVLIFTLIISIIQFTMLSFIILGSSFFLYLTKNSEVTSITTFKESVNLMLNLIGLPTVISMIYGLISFDITWMFMIQTTGLIIMLMIVYGKTKFNDKEISA